MAWETLSDTLKRGAYDLTRPKRAAVKPGTGRTATGKAETGKAGRAKAGNAAAGTPRTGSTTPPRSSDQPPRPSKPTQDTKAREQSRKKRQEWLTWETLQEDSIRQCRKWVKSLRVDIATLSTKIVVHQEALAANVRHTWNGSSYNSTTMSKEDRDEIKQQLLDSQMAVRIKEASLQSEEARLHQLRGELLKRRDLEKELVEAERGADGRKEPPKKEKAESKDDQWEEYSTKFEEAAREGHRRAAREARKDAEADLRRKGEELKRRQQEAKERWEHKEASRKRQREKEDILKQEKAADEANKRAGAMKRQQREGDRARKQAEAREKAERQKKLVEEHAARIAAAKEEATRAEAAKQKKLEKIWAAVVSAIRESQEDRAQAAEEAPKWRKGEGVKHTPCTHRAFWPKVPGPTTCRRCSLWLRNFGFQCPLCSTVVCVRCRQDLQAGPTTSTDRPS